MKKKCILISLIIILIMNSIITIPITSIAAIEDGDFTIDEWKYNIKIVKVAKLIENGIAYMLDEDGKLWKSKSDGGLEHIFKSYTFSDIVCGENHTLALDKTGHLWGWGKNGKYQLGNGTTDSSETPIQIYSTKQFKSIACSSNASFALDMNGNLYAWGSNKCGETSTETTIKEEFNNGSTTMPATNTVEVSKTPKLKMSNIAKISANYNTVLAIDNDGYAWGWGENTEGQLGSYNRSELTYKNYWTSSVSKRDFYYTQTPIKISDTIKFKDISVGEFHTILISEEGLVYTSGRNTVNGTTIDYQRLIVPTGLEEIKIEKILAGSYFSAFMDENNNIWTCGYNNYGSLGNGTTTDSATVVSVQKDSNITFVDFAISNSDNTIYTFDSNGNLWGWGNNAGKVLAIGNSKVISPIQITGIINKYTVTFKNENTVEKTEVVEKGQAATAPVLTKPGYTLTWDKEFSNVTSNLEVNAIWTAKTDTAYKVIHHFRNLDTEVEGFIDEEEQKTGTTDTLAVAVYKTKEGFTKNESDNRTVKQGNIAGDGSLVLHLYYTRNTYDITYELNGGEPTGNLANKYTYGKEMILPSRVEKQGYTFAGWYDNEELTGSPITTIPVGTTGEKTFYAKWDVKGDTAYKVIHHFRNLDTEVEGFIDEEEQKTGTTDTLAVAVYKTKEGFTKNESDNRTVKQGNIAGDGSLVLHLYYTRNTYDITYELNGGKPTGNLANKYTYGKEMILPIRVEKQGYTFAGWYDNEKLTGSPITTIPVGTTGEKTFYAKWVEKDKEYYILSERYSIDLEGKTITKVSPETTVESFLNKIETNGTCKVLNAKGQEVNKTELVGTGYKLQVTFKGQVYTYEIAVRGDIDGNGKITITDLSMLNQSLMEKITLTGIKEKAADINYTDGITITDLSMLNQALMKKITL